MCSESGVLSDREIAVAEPVPVCDPVLIADGVGGEVKLFLVTWAAGQRPAMLVVDAALCTDEMLEECDAALRRIFVARDPSTKPTIRPVSADDEAPPPTRVLRFPLGALAGASGFDHV